MQGKPRLLLEMQPLIFPTSRRRLISTCMVFITISMCFLSFAPICVIHHEGFQTEIDLFLFKKSQHDSGGWVNQFNQLAPCGVTTFLNAIPRKQAALTHEDVTLVTHTDVSNLHKLLLQAKHWGGLMSVAVFLRDQKDALAFKNFLHQFEDYLRQISFHLYFENNEKLLEYPVNIVRNIALENGVETDYVLILDVDFLPPLSCKENLAKAIKGTGQSTSLSNALMAGTLLVLPAFEIRPNRTISSQTKNKSAADHNFHLNQYIFAEREFEIPETKDDLIQQLKYGKLYPFQMEQAIRGHSSTNYTKWNNISDSNDPRTPCPFYNVSYTFQYEPYVLAYKHGLPRYWEKFRGYHFNKFSWFAEAHFMGYRFGVLCNFFLVHLPHRFRHNGNSATVSLPKVRQWEAFKVYLKATYNLVEKDIEHVPPIYCGNLTCTFG